MKLYQAIILGALVLGAIFGISYKATVGSIDHVTVVVSDKGIVAGKESSKYLVYSNEETFENEDSLWMGKFNSSDFQGRIKEGHKYNFTVTGWRVPFLSMYRNIVQMEEAGP